MYDYLTDLHQTEHTNKQELISIPNQQREITNGRNRLNCTSCSRTLSNENLQNPKTQKKQQQQQPRICSLS